MATEFAHAIRTAELELALPLLPAGGRVLELGAGDGWQAQELHHRGFTVTAVDVMPSPANQTRHFPVSYYDGCTLPFPDKSFDAIYSSNVLEHVSDFAVVQNELARVLRSTGVAVHCVPSATWRLWTSLGHPLYATRWALRLGKMKWLDRQQKNAPETRIQAKDLSVAKLVGLGLLPPRHGEHGNVFSEHWLFSRWGWGRRFHKSGWRIESFRSTRIFYTGNELFGLRLENPTRHRLASILGSSTLIYVLRPCIQEN